MHEDKDSDSKTPALSCYTLLVGYNLQKKECKNKKTHYILGPSSWPLEQPRALEAPSTLKEGATPIVLVNTVVSNNGAP